MKQYSTFQLDNSNMVYSWGTTFRLLSLAKVDPFLSEIQFPFQSKPTELTGIAKEFLEQFYGIKLWDPGQKMSGPARELFEATNKKLVLSIGIEDTSIFCEWGNNLPTEKAS